MGDTQQAVLKARETLRAAKEVYRKALEAHFVVGGTVEWSRHTSGSVQRGVVGHLDVIGERVQVTNSKTGKTYWVAVPYFCGVELFATVV